MDRFFTYNAKIARSNFLCNGLVGSWGLNSGKSKFIYDKSGFDNTLELKNGDINSNYKWGLYGPCLTLDGTNYLESIAPTANKSLQPLDSLTVSAWIKITSDGPIAHCGNLSSYQGWSIFLNSGQIYFANGTGSSIDLFNSGFSISYNEWLLITVVQNSLKPVVSFYLNGFEQTQNSTMAHSSRAATTQPLRIGTDLTNYLIGEIESLFIWNRDLTPSEVGSLFVKPYQSFNNSDYSAILGLIDPIDIFNETPAGSIIAGGSALVQGNENNVNGSGGVTVGGSSVQTYNVAASGGSLVGGASTLTTQYNVVTSSGSIAGGTANHTIVDIAETFGGSIVGGAGAPSAIYDVATTNGCSINGTTTISAQYNITTTGGFVASGTASQAFTDIVETFGGSTVGGTTLTFASYAVVATSGVIINATTLANVNYNIFTAGGILINGTASQISSNVVETSGGSVTNGAAVLSSTYSITVGGGSNLGGIANQTSSNITGTVGGVAGGGTATIAVRYGVISSGGCLGGRLATPNVVYNLIIPFFAGEWTDQNYNTNDVVLYADLFYICIQSFNDNRAVTPQEDIDDLGGTRWAYYINENNVKLNGNSTSNETYNIIANGGSRVSGQTLDTFVDVVEVFGGCRISGVTTPITIFNIEATGGSFIEGKATQYISDIRTTTGGVAVGGASAQLVVFNIAASSGCRLNGLIDLNYISNVVGLGGLSASGFAALANDETMSGGVVCSGACIVEVIYKNSHKAKGKIQISGQASYSFIKSNFSYVASGGLFTIESESVFKLSYFDNPCPDYFDNAVTKRGFNCLIRYPNNYIDCQNEEDYYGQCVTLKARTVCPNKDAKLSAVTICRQRGHLPPKRPLRRR